jgi:alpha-L-rhamnosidase
VGAWFYHALAGITQQEGSSGFQQILIRPQMVRDLRYAAGTIHTPRGKITSSWTRSNRCISLDVAIPVNAQAEIHLPKFNWEYVTLKENGQQIYDGQKFLTGLQGIQMVEETKNEIIVKMGSGRYYFELFGE